MTEMQIVEMHIAHCNRSLLKFGFVIKFYYFIDFFYLSLICSQDHYSSHDYKGVN